MRTAIDTLRELASLAGVSFPEARPTPEQIERARKWERRRSILQATNEICQEILESDRGLNARQYLVGKRGISEEGIKDLGLGYFYNYNDVVQVLQERGFELDEIKSVGLKVLEGYITYPWLDANNRPLTIYGRWHTQVSPVKKPKTIALPGKSTKRSPLYLDRALQARHSEIVLVEGVNDAAVAQSLGLTNVCAYVAASCSSEQIETLKKKGIKKVILCGDPDSAGDNGTASNLNRMIRVGIAVYIAPKLPYNLDPDEFILKYGVKTWQEHISNAEHGFRWQAKRLIQECGIDSDSAIEKLIKFAVNWANNIPSSLHKELDTFFWSEIDRHTGAISSGKFNDSLNQLQAQQLNNLHSMNETLITEIDEAKELKL
jgi:putative DNA primase/helicase